MIREAGFLRKLPDDDNLYLTIDGNRAIIRGVDIPRILTGTQKPILHKKRQVGTIRAYHRPGHTDLILIETNNLEYRIWQNLFVDVWNQELKWAKVFEKVMPTWYDCNRQEATA
ncbi:MAG: hypothetical protein M0Q91_12495 [Methanoregula sp.]|jgi:hypothetical protein|nr:hypothetical protein [Methanoregula sp.]